MSAPTDAHLEYKDGKFQIAEEQLGNQLDIQKADRAIDTAIKEGLEQVSLEEQDCYIAPKVYKEDEKLKKECEDANKMLVAKITYDFGDRKEVVDSDEIADWITFGDDYTFDLDEEKITEYVHQLGLKYDTFGLSRKFTTHDGQTITLKGGDYGWCMDQDATVVDLLNALESGYQGTMEPQYTYTAMSREENDIGDTYVEICISQQVMWCYKDGVCIVYTPVVTGNPNKGNATPSNGVWSIDAKMQNYTLVGEGYRSPVDFWMPFNGNVGIHDMQTRAYFGGTIYLTNGSHGCINTPYENAKMIYENVSIGTPVIVYD